MEWSYQSTTFDSNHPTTSPTYATKRWTTRWQQRWKHEITTKQKVVPKQQRWRTKRKLPIKQHGTRRYASNATSPRNDARRTTNVRKTTTTNATNGTRWRYATSTTTTNDSRWSPSNEWCSSFLRSCPINPSICIREKQILKGTSWTPHLWLRPKDHRCW